MAAVDGTGPFSADAAVVYLADESGPVPIALAAPPDGEAWAVRIARALNAAHRAGQTEVQGG